MVLAILARCLRRTMRASSIVVISLFVCVLFLAYFSISRQSHVGLEGVHGNEKLRHSRKSLEHLNLEQLVRHQEDQNEQGEKQEIENLKDELPNDGASSKDFKEVGQIKTFFDVAEFSYKDIELKQEDGIPTQEFIRASRYFSKLMDHLGSNSMARRMVDKNFEILQAIYDRNPEENTTLQKIVKEELANERSEFQVALVWTTRPLSFLYHFLLSIVETGIDTDTVEAGKKSYSQTLMPYHSRFTIMAANAAMQFIPNCRTFLEGLCVDEKDLQNPEYYNLVIDAIDRNIEPMGKVLYIVKNFYEENGLEY